jgi:hypothetical protein
MLLTLCLYTFLCLVSVRAEVYSYDRECSTRLCEIEFKDSGLYTFLHAEDAIERIIIKPRFPASVLDISKLDNLRTVQIYSETPNCLMLICRATSTTNRMTVLLVNPTTDINVTCCNSVRFIF